MEGDGLGLPTLVFEHPGFSGHEQFALAHDQISPAIDTAPLGPAEDFRGGSRDYLIADAALSTIHFTAQAMRRTPGHFATSTSEMLGVLVPRSGSIRGEVGRSTSFDVGVGSALVLDFTLPFHLQSQGTDLLWLTLPRSRVAAADRWRRSDRVAVIDAGSRSGRAAMATIATTWAELPVTPAAEAPALADRLIDVVDAALAPAEAVASPEALRASMKTFLRDHLDDLDLGIDDLRGAFHCSRSSVYRLFEPDGGVDAFIRHERLHRCFRELTSPALDQRQVSAIAGRWGYQNPSHFNRLFKRAFGVAPTVMVERSLMARERYVPEISLEIRRLHDWIGA